MTVEELKHVCSRTREVMGNVPPDLYGRPTPCRSWDVRRLINHTVAASLWVADCVTAGVAPDHDSYEDNDYAAGDVLSEYDRAVTAAADALGQPAALDTTIRFPFGTLTGKSLLGILVDDQFVHAWDIAKATGQSMTDADEQMAEQLLAEHAGRSLDQFRGPDGKAPYGPEVPVPSTAPATDRLAGFFGRTP